MSTIEEIPDSTFIHPDNYQKLFDDALRDKAIPRYLYKFMSIEGAVRFLKTSKLLFAKPDMFNDPFDCKTYIDIKNATKGAWTKFFQEHTPDQLLINSLVNKIISDDDNHIQPLLQNYINLVLQSCGVLCLTSVFDNILMWSHYADSHKGVCLRFDISKDCDSFCFPVNVIYNDEYTTLDYVEDHNQLHKALMHKSADWSYEKEYRVIRINGYGLQKIKRESVDSIIFGCKATDEDVRTIRNAVTENNFNSANYIKAVTDEKSYKLNFYDA